MLSNSGESQMSYRRLTLCCLWGILFLISGAFGEDNAGVVFLVRHAEKTSDAKDALLSPQGHERAECLAHVLKDSGIREILVTRVIRTQQTAAPLAKTLGIKPTILEADDIAAFVKKLQAAKNETVLVVGHGDTLPKIAAQLGGGAISMEDAEYDKLFVFHYAAIGNGGKVVTLRYCDCK